jgi:hypothetical protein
MSQLTGIIANQRFTGHTNPIMTAAVGDGGSILDREYVQRAYKGVHDAGHADNLKFWGCAGLAKLRNSGGVDYVSKGYDLSGNGYHYTQATEANQPVLTLPAFVLDGTDVFAQGSTIPITDFTILAWIKTSNSAAVMRILSHQDTNTGQPNGVYYLRINAGKVQSAVRPTGGSASAIITTTTVSDDAWHLVAVTRSGATMVINIDGDEDISEGSKVTGIIDSGKLALGALYYAATPSEFFIGSKNDIRLYNTALTATEIAAIYNQTSYRYA